MKPGGIWWCLPVCAAHLATNCTAPHRDFSDGVAAAGQGGGEGATELMNAGSPSGLAGDGPSAGGGEGASGHEGGASGHEDGASECAGDVADDPECWTTEELGVFVSGATGDDDHGMGTRAQPFATVSKGVSSADGKNIYVCSGAGLIYGEQLTITAAVGDGVRLYGGFECADWTYDSKRYVTLKSPDPVALRIKSVGAGVQIENMKFIAADGRDGERSSYGAFVSASKNVVLRRVQILAGDGFAGADGAPGGAATDGIGATTSQDGESAACASPGDAAPGEWSTPACGSKGGRGGVGAQNTNGGNGAAGTPLTNVTTLNNLNQGIGTSIQTSPGGDGKVGAKGVAGQAGAQAASKGEFAGTGYSTANGHDGVAGFPGQGGGGGGGSKGTATCRGASGGAGGMGGCGGEAGAGGQGGGASIGLFSWDSEIELLACSITSGNGGAGGNGGSGGKGGNGAAGGRGGAASVSGGIARGGNGGIGGNGGDGGSGSGGTGGPSHAVVHFGMQPSYIATDSVFTHGAGGRLGAGGLRPGGELAPDGSRGEETDLLVL